MKIIVPMVPPSANELKRKYRNPHAYARLRDSWEQAIAVLTARADRKILLDTSHMNRMIVHVTVHNSRMYDSDNLAAAQKPILDSLKRLEYIHDDSDKWAFVLSPTMVQAPRGKGFTEIDIAVDWNSTRIPGKVPSESAPIR